MRCSYVITGAAAGFTAFFACGFLGGVGFC